MLLGEMVLVLIRLDLPSWLAVYRSEVWHHVKNRVSFVLGKLAVQTVEANAVY